MTHTYRNYVAAVVRFHLVAADAGDLGPTDYQASSLLDLNGPLAPGRLSELLRLSPSATTRVIDRLTDAGIAERTTDPGDRRRVLVAHTGHVPEPVQRLLDSVRLPIAEVVDTLDEGARAGLVEYFRGATEAYRRATS